MYDKNTFAPMMRCYKTNDYDQLEGNQKKFNNFQNLEQTRPFDVFKEELVRKKIRFLKGGNAQMQHK